MNGWRSSGRGALKTVLAALPLLLAGCASTVVQENLAETSAFAAREIGTEIQLQSTSNAREMAASVARELLAEPLTADGTAQLALGYSPVTLTRPRAAVNPLRYDWAHGKARS